MDVLLAGITGAMLGAVLLAALCRKRSAQAFEQGRASTEAERAAMSERLRARDTEVDRLASDLQAAQSRHEAVTAELRAEAERRGAAEQAALRIPELQQALQDAVSASAGKDEQITEGRSMVARLTAELEAERAMLTEKMTVLSQAQEQLTSAFRALSAQALQANNQSFLDLAAQALGKFQQGAQGDLDKRQQAIHELVAPVKASLEKLDCRIGDIEKTREGAYQSLTTQVRSLLETQSDLRRETSNLVRALRQPVARGRWGELQLRRVVEMAGMLEHCDFTEQVTVQGEESKLRPDLIVRLPGGRNIVVDAKTPLSAYLEAAESQDENIRKQHLVGHARQVRDHMTKLGRKAYHDQFDYTPELVVLFLPGEMFFSAALEQDPELIEFGVSEKVIPATPTTLIAMLRAIAYGWKQEALARNAQEISDLGRELHERIAVLTGHWSKVGKNLSSAVGAYNMAVASLESRVLVSARKFKDLKATADGKHIPTIDQVELLPRAILPVEADTVVA